MSSAYHPRQMVNSGGRSSHLRTYYGHVYWITWVLGMKCYRWSSLPTTTTFTRALAWRHMRLYTAGSVELPYVGIRMGKQFLSDQSRWNKLLRKWEWWEIWCKLIRVDRRPMQTAGGDLWSSRQEIVCSWGWPEPLVWEGLSAQGNSHLSFLALTRYREGLD